MYIIFKSHMFELLCKKRYWRIFVIRIKKYNAILSLFLIIVNLFFLYQIANLKIVFGRLSGWFYPYINYFSNQYLLVGVGGALTACLLAYVTEKYLYKKTCLVVFLWFIFAFIIQIALFELTGHFSFGKIVSSVHANTFFIPTLKFSFYDYVSNYFNYVNFLPIHIKQNMIGKVVFYYFLTLFTDNSQVMGYLIVFFSNLGGILIFLIGRKLFGSRKIGFYAMVLYYFIPGKFCFLPILNTISPVIILTAFYLLLLAIDNKGYFYEIFLGITLYMVLFFDPIPLSVGVIFAGILLFSLIKKRIDCRRTVEIILISFVSFIVFSLFVSFVFNYNIYQNFLYVYYGQSKFIDIYGKLYSNRLWVDLKEYFITSGISINLLLIWFLFYCCKRLVRRKLFAGLLSVASYKLVYYCFFVLTFLIIYLWGICLGEVARVWIFLSCFAVLIPGCYFRIIGSRAIFYIMIATLIFQMVLMNGMIGFVIP